MIDQRIDRPYESFTRSNGTLFARIYERLTKRSRRRAIPKGVHLTNTDIQNGFEEEAYRKGVYDTLHALRSEVS